MDLTIIETVPEEGYDYYQVFIFDENNECLENYGDSYHDKGSERSEGFVDCWMIYNPGAKVEVIELEVGRDNYCLEPKEVLKIMKKKVKK